MEGEISDKTKEEIQKLETKEEGKNDEENKKTDENKLNDETTPIKHELSKASALPTESIKESPDEDENKEGGKEDLKKNKVGNQELQNKYNESDNRFK